MKTTRRSPSDKKGSKRRNSSLQASGTMQEKAAERESPVLSRLLNAAVTIRTEPNKVELAFLARQFIQATLPHSDPRNVPLWTRRNGNITLSIRPGDRDGRLLGYPYGTLPRLLLFWMTTEALRTKNRHLDLGNTLSEFMRELGLNPNNGSLRSKRSDARRLMDQMVRLFSATISFQEGRSDEGRKGIAWMNMQVAPEGVLWWDKREPEQSFLWGSWIQLSERFYEAITAAPVPVDMRALRALKRSPLALDLYAWTTYTAYQAQKTGQGRLVEWEWLHTQFGADYTTIKDFKRKAKAALRKVQIVYPELELVFERGAVLILPCNPAVTSDVEKRAMRAKREAQAMPSEKALEIFHERYPNADVNRCIEDWQVWLAGKGITPRSCDAMFLDFAPKWAASRS